MRDRSSTNELISLTFLIFFSEAAAYGITHFSPNVQNQLLAVAFQVLWFCIYSEFENMGGFLPPLYVLEIPSHTTAFDDRRMVASRTASCTTNVRLIKAHISTLANRNSRYIFTSAGQCW